MVSKYWKKFENSGKIEDYLSFVSSAEREKEAAGTNDHAGEYHCNGNYIETVSGGRIRPGSGYFDEGAR